jgi:hypothetical protein
MSNVTISRKLNITFPIETSNGKVYVHSVPISRNVFEDNFLVISRAFTSIYLNNLGPVTGPRVGKLMLKHEAESLGIWDQVQQTLMTEINRLTNIAAPGKDGWHTVPFNDAVRRGILDEDNAADIENTVVFFICASAIHLPQEFKIALSSLHSLWSAETTSLNVTEFSRSLPTLMPEENIGEKMEQLVMDVSESSIPH